MPLYEYRKNAENKVPLDNALRAQVRTGLAGVMDEIVRVAAEARKQGTGGVTLAWDGWYGVKFTQLAAEFEKRAAQAGRGYKVIRVSGQSERIVNYGHYR
jgi:hypothetical protein